MPITFAFPRDTAGLAGIFRGIRQGSDFVLPTLDLGALPHQLSALPLAGAAAFVEAWQDRLDDAWVTRVRGLAFADQTGTLYLETSPDQAAVTALTSLAVAPGVPADTGWWNLSAHRYYRRRFLNGGTAQGTFQLYGAQEFARGDSAGPVRGPLTDRSGTIANGGTSQQLAAANPQRRYLYIQNNSAGALWVNFGTAAALGQPSIQLAANAEKIWEKFVPTEAINIIGGTTAQPFTAKEG